MCVCVCYISFPLFSPFVLVTLMLDQAARRIQQHQARFSSHPAAKGFLVGAPVLPSILEMKSRTEADGRQAPNETRHNMPLHIPYRSGIFFCSSYFTFNRTKKPKKKMEEESVIRTETTTQQNEPIQTLQTNRQTDIVVNGYVATISPLAIFFLKRKKTNNKTRAPRTRRNPTALLILIVYALCFALFCI